jgi:uncharacterized protein (TIGR03546 family)
MYTLYKLLRNVIRSVASQAAPWQIAIGTFLGTLIGFLPLWPFGHMPSPLGWTLVLVALIINCHLGSVLVFMGLGKTIALALKGPAVAIGTNFSDLAQRSADVPFLYLSYWSHTGWLGKTLLGFAFAPLFAIFMLWLTRYVRTRLMTKLLERKALVKAGGVVNKAWLVKTACWFFGL